MIACHVLESRRSINIVQLLRFVDDCFDVGALHQRGFAYSFLPFLLLLSEIIVCDMSDGFKAPWKRHISLLISFADLSEPVEYLLIIKVLVGEFEGDLLDFEFAEAALLILHLLVADIFSEQDHLVVCASCDYPWEAALLWMYLGMSSARPFCLRFLL